MAMTGVLRPGYVQLRVMDLEAARTHYRDRMGLEEVASSLEKHIFLRAYDEFDHHSVVLREADEPGLEALGFKVAREEDLDQFATRLADRGHTFEWIAEDEALGLGRRLRFGAPSGHCFEFYATMALAPDGPAISNPDLWRNEPRGMRVLRFDHCALLGSDIDASAEIFAEVFGFVLAEELVDEESGQRIAIFLSCSTKAHDLAFLLYPENGRLHHASFNVESWHDVGHASDIVARYDISLDIGPTRHGITRGQTIYFFDPSGNRNEIFSGGYSFYPDNPKRVWSARQTGKAIFYYEKAVHERFLKVAT